MKKLLTSVAILASTLCVHAEESDWRFFAGLGFASGGETLYSGTITDVSNGKVTPFDIQAGTGFQQRIGADYRVSEHLTVQGSIGHSASEAMGYDGSGDFTTIPLELMAFADAGNGLRLGAGVRKSWAELRGTGKATTIPINGSYAGSEGAVLEVQYLFANGPTHNGKGAPRFGLSLRGVTETFTHPLGTLKGDHTEIGVVLYY